MKVKAFILLFSVLVIAQTADPFYGSVYFDNNSDYVFITNTSSLNVQSNVTIEAWVRSADDNGSIIYRQNNTQNFDPYFTIGIDDGCYHFSYRTDQNGLVELKQPDCTTDDTWHHIAAVIDDDSSFLYINGEQEVSMESPDGNLPEDFPMFFGVDGVFAPLTNYFKGNLDEVRIWNRALTRNEIHQNLWNELDVNSENGLVGYWNLNEFSGTGNNKIEDKTSNSADGTVYNAVQSNLSPVEIPRQIAITPQDGKIIINWKDVSSNSISGYKIFRSTDMNASTLLTTVGGNDTTYIDETEEARLAEEAEQQRLAEEARIAEKSRIAE